MTGIGPDLERFMDTKSWHLPPLFKMMIQHSTNVGPKPEHMHNAHKNNTFTNHVQGTEDTIKNTLCYEIQLF